LQKNARNYRNKWRITKATKAQSGSINMHDYMAIKGNSSSAIAKQQRRDFLKMVAVNGVRVLVVAIIVLLTTK